MNGNSTCNRGEHFLAGLGIRPVVPRGETIHGHAHNKDHVTFLARGSVEVRKRCPCNPDAEQVHTYVGPTFFNIEATWLHEIRPLTEDVLYWCVFASPDSKSLEDAFWDMAEARV